MGHPEMFTIPGLGIETWGTTVSSNLKGGTMTTLLNDLRCAWRQLRKAPGFTLTAVITLALGIGISAAMFAVVDGVLLRPLPVPHPNQIVALGEQRGAAGVGTVSLPNIRDWRAQAKSFQDIAWYTQFFFNLKKPDGSADFSINIQASPNFFSMLRATPALGRVLSASDAHSTESPIVISNYVWRNYLHSDPYVLGRHLQVGSTTYTVVGVMPKLFYLPLRDDGPIVWSVLTPSPAMGREDGFLNGIGRLKPAISVAAAKTELSGIEANLARLYPDSDMPKAVDVVGLRQLTVGSAHSGLLALQGAVLLVWLIACANVAGLLLTRMSARRREIAVRAALGASRSRIVRQFLTESLVIGFASGALGYGVAALCLHLLSHSIHANLSRASDVALNWHAVLALIGLSILSAAIFGTVPALQAASANPQDALHQGSLAAGSGRGQLRLRNLLIIGELALSLVLLSSAGLLLRTLYALRNVDLGFNQHKMIDAMFFPAGGFDIFEKTQPVIDTIYTPLLARVRSLPGVKSAALMSRAPLSYQVSVNDGFTVFGQPGPERHTQLAFITPRGFRTLGIPMRYGREFGDEDRPTTTPVCVINQAFARTFLAGRNPLNTRLNLDTDSTDKSIFHNVQIVGVIGDATLGRVGDRSIPMVYTDLNQMAPGDSFYPVASVVMELVVRTRQNPKALVPSIRKAFAQVAPGVSIGSIHTFREKIDGELGSQTLAARLLWIFAIAAVFISAAGLYGLLSYSVTQRTREIGVRIALGAQRSDILRVILRQAGRLLLTGVVLGLLCAFFLGRFVRSFLYGVSQHDGLTLLIVAALLLLVGLAAAYIPARRASRIEPTEALRAE